MGPGPGRSFTGTPGSQGSLAPRPLPEQPSLQTLKEPLPLPCSRPLDWWPGPAGGPPSRLQEGAHSSRVAFPKWSGSPAPEESGWWGDLGQPVPLQVDPGPWMRPVGGRHRGDAAPARESDGDTVDTQASSRAADPLSPHPS